MMKLIHLFPVLAAGCLLASPPARAALLVHYTFDAATAGDLADATTITNDGTSGADGTISLSGGVMTIEGPGPGDAGLGNYLNIQPASDADEGVTASHISSNTSVMELGLGGDRDYTMMAWVRFDNQTGDNMVFGGTSGNVLHLGSRAANYWSGHWGDDINSAGNPSTATAEWHHVTWTNTGATQAQEILVDGVSSATGGDGAAGGFNDNLGEILLVGSSRNQGSFRGSLDDVRVYDEVLSIEQIEEIIAESEPIVRNLLIHYTFDFEPTGSVSNGASLINDGTSGINGTAGVPGGGMMVQDDSDRVNGDSGALRKYLTIRPSSDADEGTNAPHISTGSALSALGIDGNKPYTMMAWVRFDNQVGDNIVFGGNTGAVLQLGSSGDDFLSGHGGGDEIDSSGNPNSEVGTWHHVAWSNAPVADGDNSGAQEIYIDGVLETGPGATAVASAIDSNLGEVLLVGTSISGGSFSGALDDIRVYDGQLGASELMTIIDEATGPTMVGEGLLIHYTFDTEPTGALADGADVGNSGTSGTDAVAVIPGGSMTISNDDDRVNGAGGQLGNYLNVQPGSDDLEGTASTHLDTGRTVAELSLGGDIDYTMMAWVKFDNQTNDNMVFGGATGNVLHNGSRGSSYWSGHWGDDINSADNPGTDAGNWHHVTWTNEGITQTQEIFVDAVSSATGGTGNAGGFNSNRDVNLLVATSRNQGSFRGSLDDVRVYDSVLTAEEIEEIMNSTTVSGTFRFTAISHDSVNDTITVTFTSSPGQTYSLFWSPDLQDGPDYIEIDDGIQADPEGDMTTITIPTPSENPADPSPARVFLIMREN
ncbi:MAG: LamG-like jellyroll fold domain-containing protein [Verrucomicrobiales bacterium]